MQTLGEIQPGQTLGRYEFLVPIAQGGMAAVWAARLHGTRGFSKTVAVKTMLPSISDDELFEQMFLDEATLASAIRHPNVCQIHDLGEQDDVLYLVMEWVDGEPVSAVRKAAAKQDRSVPRPLAVKIIQDACAGVHAAHELEDGEGSLVGLVHRDISPQNLLITYDGVVKIVDFGVAKAKGRATGQTGAGQIKGKPAYMSPEQALGEEVDRRTDVFALGIILYQLTTGRHPFRGETDIATLQNIVADDPVVPPRTYDSDYPRLLEQVLSKALSKDKESRYQTAAEFEAALERVFPPSVPRARTKDVGIFVTELLGERGKKRREALKEAIRLADERAAGNPRDLALQPLGDIGSRPSLLSISGIPGGPLSSPDAATFPDLQTDRLSGPPSSTPMGTETSLASVPPPRKSGLAVGLVIGGLLGLLALGGVAMLLTGGNEPTESAPVPASTPAVGVALQPEPADTVEQIDSPDGGIDAGDSVESLEVDDLEVEPDEPAVAKGPSARRVRPTAPAKPKPEEETPAPKPPKSGGFVPPPVTDPGF